MASLATVGELENHLQRPVDVPAQGQQALDLASGAVRAYCGWNLARETTTLQVDGDGSQVLSLPTLHLLAITDIRVNGETLNAADYPRYSLKGQLYRAGGWTCYAVIEVDCIHGYDPVPDLLKLVVLDMAARQYSNPQQLVSATTGQVSRTWSTGNGAAPMSALHERLLDRYRLF